MYVGYMHIELFLVVVGLGVYDRLSVYIRMYTLLMNIHHTYFACIYVIKF